MIFWRRNKKYKKRTKNRKNGNRRNAYICVKKNYKWIWISVDRIRKKFIDFKIGSRDIKTGAILFKKMATKSIMGLYKNGPVGYADRPI